MFLVSFQDGGYFFPFYNIRVPYAVYGLLEFYNKLQDENSNEPNVFDVKFANVLLTGVVKNHTLKKMNGFDESHIALTFARGKHII